MKVHADSVCNPEQRQISWKTLKQHTKLHGVTSREPTLVSMTIYSALRRGTFFPMPPHVLCGLRGPPSWAWQECKRLLRLGRPWGAVMSSRWCVSGDSGGCNARRGLKPKVYLSTQTMVTAGIFPFKENSHGRTGNRTRDLMISSQRLWPLDHVAGQKRCLIYILSLIRHCQYVTLYDVRQGGSWMT